jgi:A/G-specific adenine glycosylase
MLQQTTVAAVIPHYKKFFARFPTLAALAEASEEAVLREWAGLGYYARARNLHACARILAARGEFPSDVHELRRLPGIGPYTAAAIAAIAFGKAVVPVDANVARVLTRVFAITTPLPKARPHLERKAAELAATEPGQRRPGDLAQALFDLGAIVCTPKSPRCAACPWSASCAGRAQGIAESLPRSVPKMPRPERYGVHFWLTDAEGNVLLRRRPSRGLLGGMSELPGTPWVSEPYSEKAALAAAPMPASWRRIGQVRHGFTHFALTLEVFAAAVPRIETTGFLCPIRDLHAHALPTLMRKCVRLAESSGLMATNTDREREIATRRRHEL